MAKTLAALCGTIAGLKTLAAKDCQGFLQTCG